MIVNEIQESLDKIENQLLCFETKNIYDKFHQSLCEMFANFILDLRSNSIDGALHKLDKIYQNNIEIIENKVYFKTYDVSKIAALVFQKLYEENKNIAFETYIELIENKIYENEEWYYLDFGIWNEYENIHIKNYFFEKAIEYIKENQINLQSFFDSFREKDICRFDRDIPVYFDDLYDFFLWLRNSGFINCFYNIHVNTDSKIKKLYNLIQTIIDFYNYNTHYINYKQKNPIFKLFNLNNDFINGILFSSKNIRLNIFLLKHFEYSIFGFINLIEEMYKKANEKYFKFLVNQLVEVFFKHFYDLNFKEQFHIVIFAILNGLIIKNNDLKFEVIDKIFGQLEIIEIHKEAYIKEFLFSYIFSNIVKLQLKSNTIESYFLLSKYFKLANKLDIKVDNCLQISVLCKIENLLNEDNLFLDFNFIEKIDFSLFYNPLYKDKLLNLLNIDEKKQTWQEIQAQRKKRSTISSNDRQEPKNQIKLYFKILSDVFVKTYYKNIQHKIIELAKHFGLDVEFGIFEDFIFDRNFFYEKFLKILNLFDEKFFDTFLYELQIKNEIFKLIKLFNYTYSLKRKEKILNTIKRLEKFNFDFWKKFNHNKKNVIEAIELLISNQLFELANKILDFIDFCNKEIEYLKCEKEILDLFFDNKNKDEKFRKLHQIKYPQDDKNRGIESLYNKCEEYKTLIRALIFFDDEPEKTAIILENEISKVLNYKKLYFVNLIESRIKIFIKDKNNLNYIKLKNITDEYNNFLIINKLNKELFDYKAFLSAYIELNDYINAYLIIDKLPNYYLRDFEMTVLKYNFLKKFESEIKAAEFLNNQKEFLTDEEIKKVEEAKLDDLFNYRKEIREHLRKTLEYHFAISFAGEYRPYMQILEKELRKLGYKVFLDCIYENEMLGEDLIEYLTNVFKYKAEYVVIFVSSEYKAKFYTNDVERPAIIDRKYFQDCIILLQFDDTKLNGIPDSIFYLDLKDKKLEEIDWKEIANKLKEKYESIGV